MVQDVQYLKVGAAAGHHPCQAKISESREQETEQSKPLGAGERSGPYQFILQKDSANTAASMCLGMLASVEIKHDSYSLKRLRIAAHLVLF